MDSFDKLQEFFAAHSVACDGAVVCSVEEWNALAQVIMDYREKTETLKNALSNTLEYIDNLENSMERMEVSYVVHEDMPSQDEDWSLVEYVALAESL